MSQPDEKPWTEQQWEDFMNRADLRAARFGEILETICDQPDRHDILAHEMGWASDNADESRPEWNQPLDDTLADINPGDLADTNEDPVENLPVYRLALALGDRVLHALRPYLQRPEDSIDERLPEAYINALIPAAKIAGGHGMGYDDQVLCGNIVQCRRALNAAKKSRTLLCQLRDEKQIPADLVNPLLLDYTHLEHSLSTHITHLRSKVWW